MQFLEKMTMGHVQPISMKIVELFDERLTLHSAWGGHAEDGKTFGSRITTLPLTWKSLSSLRSFVQIITNQ